MGTQNFEDELDIIRTIRRTRMHGFGLLYLLSPSKRHNAARLGFSKKLKTHDKRKNGTNDITEILNKWNYIENISVRD